jgi:GNAT superfamily N-acetyltransferase
MIRNAQMRDTEAILLLLDGAITQMEKMNIPQWLDGYPGKADVLKDMENQSAFVFEENGKLLGYAALEQTPDANYAKLYDGTWLDSSGDYATIHRSAIDTRETGKGYGTKFFAKLEELA